MDYCDWDKAFDNPIGQKLQEYEQSVNNYKEVTGQNIASFQHNNNISPPHTVEHFASSNFEDPYQTQNIANSFMPNQMASQYMPNDGIIQYPQFQQSFFSAQGDLNGTSVDQLRDQQGAAVFDDMTTFDTRSDTIDLSMLESEESASLPSLKSYHKPKRSHNYYIKKFISRMMDEEDMMSMASSQDDDVWQHVQKCKYCRTQVSDHFKIMHTPMSEYSEEPEKPNVVDKIKTTRIGGYDLKEIMVMIIVGICFIFMLDVFFKLGRKTLEFQRK